MTNMLTYSPDEVSLHIADGYLCSGWGKITIVRDNPVYKFIKGIRGKNTRVKDRNTSCIVTISVAQSSPTNDVFSEILEQDYFKDTGRFSLNLNDKSGNSSFSTSEAYVIGFPEVTYEDGLTYNEWRIQCLSTSLYRVGNNVSENNNSVLNKILELFN